MNQIKIILFVISILLAPSSSFAQTRIDSALAFFPIAVGDVWVYNYNWRSSSQYNYKVEISGNASMPNGYTYRIFVTTNLSSRKVDTVFKRIDSSTAIIWQYRPQVNDEYMVDGLADAPPINHIMWSQEVVLGLLRTVRWDGYTGAYSRKYAAGLGLTYYYWEDVWDNTQRILYAKIDGKEYGDISLDVNEDHLTTPRQYILLQNFPNPFNPTTTISFKLPTKSTIRLTVYDVLGKEVTILANEELNAGTYSRIWNASTMPSGVYFYRLQAGSFSEIKRLILLR